MFVPRQQRKTQEIRTQTKVDTLPSHDWSTVGFDLVSERFLATGWYRKFFFHELNHRFQRGLEIGSAQERDGTARRLRCD